MKTILYNPIFINPQAYYVFPRLTRYLQPDNESTAEPANYIGTIEVKVIAYGDTTLKRTYTNTDSIDLSEFKNTWIRISLFTKVGSCVLGEWKIGNMESDLPYIDPEVLASLKAVVIVGNKTNNDSDRAIVKNLVDPDNPFVISNAAFKLNSGFGKYGMDFLEWKANSGMNFTSTKLTSTKPNLPGGWLTFRNVSGLISETKVKVSGAPKEFVFIGNNNGADDKFSVTINNGVYTIPEFTLSSASGFYINNNSGDWSNLVIEQIPSFEGAFVTDGIDDLIKSTKSATEMLDGSNEVTVVSMIHQIKTNDDTTRNNWFFTPVSYLENRVVKDKIGKTGIYGYTSTNVTNAQISDITPILGDKNDYTLYSKIEDGDRDYFTVEGFQNQGIWYVSSIAWYWTIIANKVLTTDQINQVIAYFNLDRTLKPDILCNTIKQGITNENHAEFGDKLIDYSGNGRDIQLNNIAWKGDSGIGKYSADFESFDWAVGISQKQHNKATMSLNSRLCNHTAIEVDEMKVNIIGNITELVYWYIANPDDTTRSEIRLTSGINTLPKSYAKDDGQTYNIGFAYISGDSEITIEQIPSHAGNIGHIYNYDSPQEVNITIDEYIRYEDIVQPYPVLLRFNDESGKEVSWGGKFRVGSTITRIGSAADSNLLPNIYNIFGLLLNDNQVTSSKVIVEKTMVFKAKSAYIFDNNEPKVILSPSRLRIPNSSYKILGYIPDISGHGNHGVIHNSAYTGMSGANGYTEDFTKWTLYTGVKCTDSIISLDSSFNKQDQWILFKPKGSNINQFTINIKGIPDGGNLYLRLSTDSNIKLENGINEISSYTNVTNSTGFFIGANGLNLDWSNLVIEQVGEYEGAYCLDGVDDFVTIPTVTGGKQVLMKVNWQSIAGTAILYDQRTNGGFAIFNRDYDTNENKVPAYRARNIGGNTYIDGILNEYIYASQLQNITHNIVELYDPELNIGTLNPKIGSSYLNSNYAQMSLYDFMLFDNISTDDKIKQLNEYVGIEGNTEWRKTK